MPADLSRREPTPEPRKPLESWQKPGWEAFDVDEGGLVIVAGRIVPHLRCRRIVNEFEGFRFHVGDMAGTVDCSIDDAPHIAAVIAAALAVGAGYVGWPDGPEKDFVRKPFGSVAHHLELPS